MQMRLLKLKQMQNANISHSVISITPNKKCMVTKKTPVTVRTRKEMAAC